MLRGRGDDVSSSIQKDKGCCEVLKKKKKNPDLLIYGMLIIFRFHFPIAKHLEKYFEVIQKINVR